MSTVVDQVRQIAADVFDEPIANVSPESTPGTLDNWDSLTHLNLTLALEQVFGCQIGEDEAESMKSIADVVRVIESKLPSP
jgi:acyl carrier protein